LQIKRDWEIADTGQSLTPAQAPANRFFTSTCTFSAGEDSHGRQDKRKKKSLASYHLTVINYHLATEPSRLPK